MKTIAVLGTLDTKGREHAYLADCIQAQGDQPLLIDVGTGGPPQVHPDIDREAVAAAGDDDLKKLLARDDRGECVAAMAAAAPRLLRKLHDQGRIDGAIALGGSGGTAIAAAAMRALPIGFPKVIVSTMAGGDTARYVGTSDVTMIPSIVDVAGLNRVSRLIFARAAGAVCGMASAAVPSSDDDRPLIAASMFGNTTDCVNAAQAILERAGYEVLVFHATGAGGRAMESLIESGLIAGVLDVTTTEWADELVGGVLAAGPTRLEAAGRAGVPAVVAPGCLDMVNFGEPASIPSRFAGRRFYEHNPQITLMRTTPDECRRLGEIVAEKLRGYTAPTTLLIPLRGVSVISAAGGAFHDPVADAALFDALKAGLAGSNVAIKELDCTINAAEFAAVCAEALLANIRQAARSSER